MDEGKEAADEGAVDGRREELDDRNRLVVRVMEE